MYIVCPTCDAIIYIDASHRLCPECGQDLFGDWKTNDSIRNICKDRCGLKLSDCQKRTDCRFSKSITIVEKESHPIDIPVKKKEASLSNTESELSLLIKERFRKEYKLSGTCFRTWIKPLRLTIDRPCRKTTLNIEMPFPDIHTQYVKRKYADSLKKIASDILQEDVELNCIERHN